MLKSKSWRKQTSFKIKFPIHNQLGGSWFFNLGSLGQSHRALMHNSVALNPDQKMQVGMGVAARKTFRSPLCSPIQFSPPRRTVPLSLTCCIPHDYWSNDLDNFTFSELIPLSFFRLWRNLRSFVSMQCRSWIRYRAVSPGTWKELNWAWGALPVSCLEDGLWSLWQSDIALAINPLITCWYCWVLQSIYYIKLRL